MTEGHLGRTVLSREGFARQIAVGDRGSPASITPALVVTDGDLDWCSPSVSIAPFISSYDSTSLPGSLTMRGRAAVRFPFEEESPEWSCQMWHVLPPSLSDADSGIRGGELGSLLPVTWQSLRHDSRMMEIETDPEIVVLVDAAQLASDSGALSLAVTSLRQRFPASLIWCPGISSPDNLALLTMMGVDLHDLTRTRQAAIRGFAMTGDGPSSALGELEPNEHLSEWEREVKIVKAAIDSGTLRNLVEKRSLNSAKYVEELRIHDRLMRSSFSSCHDGESEEFQVVAEGCEVPLKRFTKRDVRLRCDSPTSADNPLIRDWHRRMAEEYLPPEESSQVLVLLPCSARKPYSYSQSHRRFRRVLRHRLHHEVMVTAPLGLVPRELEELWPASHYDIPVTGEWTQDELSLIHRLVQSLTERGGYELVIDHSGIGFSEESLGVEVIDTRQGDSAGSEAALSRLEGASENAAERFGTQSVNERSHLLIKFRSVSRWLHGSDSWLDGCRVAGKPPRWKIVKEKEQMAMWHPDDGRFAFSKASLPTLLDTGTLSRLHIHDGPEWRGDVFTPMVDRVDGDVRVGDEVLVLRGGSLIGSARSLASKWEYSGSPGRLAKSQHRL